ncbi:MAG TPA: hypothetical protein V6C97_01870 [Oculatellaceae cyanobacterium]
MDEARFCEQLLSSNLQRPQQVAGLIWFRQKFKAQPNSDLSEVLSVLESAGMPRQTNKERLRKAVISSRRIVAGGSNGSLKVNPKHSSALDEVYEPLLSHPAPKVSEAILPRDLLVSRRYFDRLVTQINGTYQVGWFDGTAVLMRRLIETLIIEIYEHQKRANEIKSGGTFFMLDGLINHLENDNAVTRSRNLISHLKHVKKLGDNSAHSRTYTADQADIDGMKFDFKTAVTELADLSSVLRS